MQTISKTIAIFLGLAIIYAALVIAAGNFANGFAQTVMVSIGSSVFGSGLTFFLIQFFKSDAGKQN